MDPESGEIRRNALNNLGIKPHPGKAGYDKLINAVEEKKLSCLRVVTEPAVGRRPEKKTLVLLILLKGMILENTVE